MLRCILADKADLICVINLHIIDILDDKDQRSVVPSFPRCLTKGSGPLTAGLVTCSSQSSLIWGDICLSASRHQFSYVLVQYERKRRYFGVTPHEPYGIKESMLVLQEWEPRLAAVSSSLILKFGQARKIRCDLKIPRCKQCTKANKDCQYGVRLSWPREHDGRRSLTSTQTQPWMVRGCSGHHWLNVGHQDIDFHLMLSSDAFKSNLQPKQLFWKPQSIPKLVSWVPPGKGHLEHILISYCKTAYADFIAKH